LRVDTLPEEDQKNYSLHLKNLRNDASRILTLKTDAEDRVKKENALSIARQMKADGLSILQITADALKFSH